MKHESQSVTAPAARLLQRAEAARYITVSPATFDRMVAEGTMPKPKRLYGRRLAWDVRSLDLAIDCLPSEDGEVDAPPAKANSWD